jgi:putative FmdB family regulatory protein
MKRFYDYKCTACNNIQEYHEEFKDKEIEHPCPACGFAMQRIISAPQFNFKRPKVDIKHSERRGRWNSPDPRVKI